MSILTFCLSLALALIHLTIGQLRRLGERWRRIGLSGAAGVAVAYVFMHILPDLAAHQRTLADQLGLEPDRAEMAIFATTLAGLTLFYGLERLATSTRRGPANQARGAQVDAAVFWAHIGGFGLYNVLIGYLLVHRDTPGLVPLLTFFVAMAMHFATNDFGLREHHRQRYDALGRWLVAGAVLAGWLLGRLAQLPDLGIAMLYSFLAGGVVLNVLKEELPAERQGRFLPFLIGAAGYALVLAVVDLGQDA